MKNRVLEFSQSAARLRVAHRQLVISQGDEPDRTIPMSDIAIVISAHPQVTYTQAVLETLLENGGSFVTCNSSRMPVGMLLPLDAHSTQTQRFREQLSTSLPRRKRIWQKIVAAKISMQAYVLKEQTGSEFGLEALSKVVRSGDKGNVEAWAAKRYWRGLFGEKFRRRRDRSDVNALLNYGYAVLRAATARAICAAGLHPSIGIHHRNKYNSWCLADDVMEPYRPLVDRIAVRSNALVGSDMDLTFELRRTMLEGLLERVVVNQEARTLFDALTLSCQTLVGAMIDGADQIAFPTGVFHASK